MAFAQGHHLQRFAALRDRGVNVERGIRAAQSNAVGGLTDLTKTERAKLAKAEAAAEKAAEAHLAVIADPYSTTAAKDEAAIADAKAANALVAASDEFVAAIADNREAIMAEYAGQAESAGAELVDLLSEALEIAATFARSRAAEKAMRNSNDADRLSAPTPGKIPGGPMLATLVGIAEREIDTDAPFDMVTPAEYAKLKRGQPAKTVDGAPVDALHERVRVSYAGSPGPAVAARTAEGGVA